MTDTTMNKKDYLLVLWQGRRLVIATSLIAAIIVGGLVLFSTRSFQTSSIITLRGRNIISAVLSTNMRSPFTNSAYIADIINEPFFAEQVFANAKSAGNQDKLTNLLSGRQITARIDAEINIVYLNTYGSTAKEAKILADTAIETIKGRIDKINTSSPQKIQKEIHSKTLDPIIAKINKMSAEIETLRSKKEKTDAKTNIKIAGLSREMAFLAKQREIYEQYLTDVTLSDMTSRPRLEVVMEPVVSKLSRLNSISQVFSAAVIGFIFGLVLVLLAEVRRDSQRK